MKEEEKKKDPPQAAPCSGGGGGVIDAEIVGNIVGETGGSEGHFNGENDEVVHQRQPRTAVVNSVEPAP